MIKILPIVAKETSFALKGGTAINFFIRNLPRISVDIDLCYAKIDERKEAIKQIASALRRIGDELSSRISNIQILYRISKEDDISQHCPLSMKAL